MCSIKIKKLASCDRLVTAPQAPLRHEAVIDPSQGAFGAALVDGTGWRMDRHLQDGEDHAIMLRRA
jgi:hypothetical protein